MSEAITGSNLILVVAVLVGIAAIITGIDKGIESWRHLSGQKDRAARDARVDEELRSLGNRITAAEERLQRGDERFDGLETDMTQMLTIMSAELMHTITGNSVDALRAVKAQLDEYMARRR